MYKPMKRRVPLGHLSSSPVRCCLVSDLHIPAAGLLIYIPCKGRDSCIRVRSACARVTTPVWRKRHTRPNGLCRALEHYVDELLRTQTRMPPLCISHRVSVYYEKVSCTPSHTHPQTTAAERRQIHTHGDTQTETEKTLRFYLSVHGWGKAKKTDITPEVAKANKREIKTR